MPRLWLTLLIVIFWLGATAWFLVREVAPRLRTGDPPPFTFELADEVGSRVVQWQVFQRTAAGEHKVGNATSVVRRGPNRTFELKTRYSFTDPKIALKEVVDRTHVTEEGELRSFSASLLVGNISLEVQGEVKDDYLIAHGRGLLGKEITRKVKAPRNLYNSVDLLPRVRGLYDGQRWSQPLFDPFDILAERLDMPVAVAEVSKGVLRWRDEDVPCFKIQLSKPGDVPMAVAWVRQRDGLVLQREAKDGVFNLISRRDAKNSGND